MTFDEHKSVYVLSSGRHVYANCGIVGIGPDLLLREGYDGCFEPPEWDEDADHFTQAEREEIAGHMIGLWTAWARKTPA